MVPSQFRGVRINSVLYPPTGMLRNHYDNHAGNHQSVRQTRVSSLHTSTAIFIFRSLPEGGGIFWPVDSSLVMPVDVEIRPRKL